MPENFGITRYNMKKVPQHLRPVVEELIFASDIFSGEYDNEENLTSLAASIVNVVHRHKIPDLGPEDS